MEAHGLAELRAAQTAAGRLYHEFLRVPALSAGYYRLAAGGRDPQSPHREDEMYVVLAGQAWISVGAEERAVQAGDVVYVAAGIEHRFHDIAEDLEVVVVFAPPET